MTKENLLKYAPLAGVIAVAAIACGLAGYIIAQWPAIEASIKPAIIGGAFTISAAVGGACIVVYQLNRQATIARETSAHSEALKLKKAIYDDVLKVCKAVTTGANTVDRFADSFRTAVSRARGIGLGIPHHKVEDLDAKIGELFNALSDLVRMARSWTITVPRMSHYHDVFHEAAHEGPIVVTELLAASGRHFADRSVKPAHWKAPDGMEMSQLDAATDRLGEFMDKLLNNVGDFETEMQTALLGDLFKQRN
jgi:hypothetical protein